MNHCSVIVEFATGTDRYDRHEAVGARAVGGEACMTGGTIWITGNQDLHLA